MSVDAFVVLAEPTRRRILDRLRRADSSVSELVEALGTSQPAVSKHLRVLREAGLVSCRTAAQQRIYRVEPHPLREVDRWLAPYRGLWERHLDALERHLDGAVEHRSSERSDRRAAGREGERSHRDPAGHEGERSRRSPAGHEGERSLRDPAGHEGERARRRPDQKE